ncbi:MAG TPA: serine/threonine-protein kinase [Vicinamibacterales bacterium]
MRLDLDAEQHEADRDGCRVMPQPHELPFTPPLMPSCPSCASDNPSTARFCLQCGSAIGAAAAAGATVTAAHESWPSHASDGRFPPGTLLAGRYRIAGRLGRGGMGEVYRADDMKLGQPVALKFLPSDLQRDPATLARFHHEVKIARQVSHPNVCRVYDIAEADGQHFISMEYVDGEDLRVLLRRIGRLPEDKALQIARQMCAGLAAAHDKGVLHRDLKPANVMLDGEGRVRITDFGLAAIASDVSGADLRSGTPGYMAPEQLAGREVSVASDIYSLGLVLFELFTGKPAFKATSLNELRAQQDSGVSSPSSLVPNLDRGIERVLVACLARHPAERPSSALAVAAALPGGDPLAAALAAGETPSPELVAATAITGTLTPAAAALSLAGILAALVLVVMFDSSGQLTTLTPMPYEPQVLNAKARDLLRAAAGSEGPGDAPRDYLWGFGRNTGYLAHLRSTGDAARWDGLGDGVRAPVYHFYRQSPGRLAPLNPSSYRMKLADPPATAPGVATVWSDPSGRLIRMEVVPPESAGGSAAPAPPVDWAPFFAAAGLAGAGRRDVPPAWNPPFETDGRAAWALDPPAGERPPLRVEAASYQGRPVWFRVIGPWEQPAGEAAAPAAGRAAMLVFPILLIALLLMAFLLARRNVRLGRSDMRGAFRLVFVFVAMHLAAWMLFTKYETSLADQFPGFTATLAVTLFEGLALYALYLALEPSVRRRWPDTLVSWTRALSGRLRDPLVGRDILFGCAIGVVFQLLDVGAALAARRLGAAQPDMPNLAPLTGTRFLIGEFIDLQSHAALLPLGTLIVIVLLLMLLRRTWLALLVALLLMAGLEMLGADGGALPAPVRIVTATLSWGIAIAAITRLGLLAMTVASGVYYALSSVLITTDLSAWYATGMILAVAWTLLLAGYGAWTALAGRPVFAGGWMDE